MVRQMTDAVQKKLKRYRLAYIAGAFGVGFAFAVIVELLLDLGKMNHIFWIVHLDKAIHRDILKLAIGVGLAFIAYRYDRLRTKLIVSMSERSAEPSRNGK